MCIKKTFTAYDSARTCLFREQLLLQEEPIVDQNPFSGADTHLRPLALNEFNEPHSFLHLTKDNMLAVQMWSGNRGDEELRPEHTHKTNRKIRAFTPCSSEIKTNRDESEEAISA